MQNQKLNTTLANVILILPLDRATKLENREKVARIKDEEPENIAYAL